MIGAPLPLTHLIAPRLIPIHHHVPLTLLAPPRKSAAQSNVPDALDAVNVDVYAKNQLVQSPKSAEINNPQVAGLPLLRTFACDNRYNNNNY